MQKPLSRGSAAVLCGNGYAFPGISYPGPRRLRLHRSRHSLQDNFKIVRKGTARRTAATHSHLALVTCFMGEKTVIDMLPKSN